MAINQVDMTGTNQGQHLPQSRSMEACLVTAGRRGEIFQSASSSCIKQRPLVEIK